jgi:tryptophan synthase alpha chain
MNPIDLLFRRLRSQGRKAFIPFITAGDPDLKATELLIPKLVESGASLIEIGFPYSDPIADGAVIQASYTRALDHGLRMDEIFSSVSRMKPSLQNCPLVAMLSYSLVQHRSAERFIAQAHEAGFAGAIVPDLPIEESDELSRMSTGRDFKLIQLVTPTTPRDRAVQIAQASTGFLYCVSVTGITGERDQLPHELLDQIAWLRRQTELPICVGFGISKPGHVQMLRDVADGVIVGSALVRKLEQAKTRPLDEVAQEICTLVQTLSAALG